MSFSVAGKTAIVTGAGRGIGLALTSLLLKHECNVILADLSLSTPARALLASHTPPLALYKQTDVSCVRSLRDLFQFVRAETGKEADIVMPNAGVFEPPESNFWTKIEDKPYKSIDINLRQPILMTRMAIDGFLREGKDGAVVLTGSIAGQTPNPLVPIYCATKAALNSFTWGLAPLSQVGIRVNCVAPGLIKTPLWTEHPEKLCWVDENHDVWIEPEEVAEAMLKLIESPEFPGGSVIEVTKGATRVLEVYGDKGPKGKGTSLSKGKEEIEKLMAEIKSRRDKSKGYLEGFT